MAAADKGAGPAKPRPPAAKKSAEPEPKPEPKPAAEAEPPRGPIGIEPDIRVGGHVITDDGWTPDEEA